jgi:hypothetical protein
MLHHRHRDVTGIRLHGIRSKGTNLTSPANTGPSRRRKRKSKLVPRERALPTLPGRGFNKWPGCLSWLPLSVSQGSTLCKEPWVSQVKSWATPVAKITVQRRTGANLT